VKLGFESEVLHLYREHVNIEIYETKNLLFVSNGR
jgi:hypothetical protein